MHIPDGFLDPKISTGFMAIAGAVLAFCISKVKETVTALVPIKALATTAGNISQGIRRVLTKTGEKFLYKIAMVTALVFSAQMFNFPINQGTSGHLIGGVFASVILGPFGGTIAISVVLLIQALFFADGGILALGANIFNMAIIGSLGCYYVYFFVKKILPEWLAIAFSAWLSVVIASFFCALQISFSKTIAFEEVIPAMIKVHMLIGIAEALITLGFVYLFRTLVVSED